MNTSLALLLALGATALAENLAPSVQPVAKRIDLIEVMRNGGVEYHLNADSEFRGDPKEIWKIEGGQLHITGQGSGYAATVNVYRDYHLVVEYQWGEKTWGQREHAARDNGFFVHAHGPHGALNGSWMASIEAQMIEGGTGDLIVIAPKLADEATSVMSEFTLDRDGERIWKPGSPRQLVTKGRINWLRRDVDWTDTKGFRGQADVERPVGSWNRFEVVADGASLRFYLNGVLVNEATDVQPNEGRILSTCLNAEVFVRRYELWPLGQFKESWPAKPAARAVLPK